MLAVTSGHHVNNSPACCLPVCPMQRDLEVLRSEVAKERNAAIHAKGSAMRAVQQLQAAEQEHKHTMQALEERLRHVQWALWQQQLEGVTAGQQHAGHAHPQQLQHHAPSSVQRESAGTASPQLAAAAAATGPGDAEVPETGASAQHGASTDPVVPTAHPLRQHLPDSLDVSGADGSFTIHMSSTEHGGDLELLPEVHKLMLLHRQLLGSEPIMLQAA